jgi:glycyl-tRNA synthetase beta chain
VGLFAAGQRPSGNQDPFGLRRAAAGVAAILVDTGAELDLRPALDAVAATMPVAVEPAVKSELADFLARRLEGQLRDEGHRADVVSAVLAVLSTRPAAAARAARALAGAVANPEWPATLTAYARCARIVRSTAPAQGTPAGSPAELAERALAEAVEDTYATVDLDSPEAVLAALAGLRGPINEFFERVLVMAEDPALRARRLALARRIAELPSHFSDLGLLEGF